jgi:hypothetical protein
MGHNAPWKPRSATWSVTKPQQQRSLRVRCSAWLGGGLIFHSASLCENTPGALCRVCESSTSRGQRSERQAAGLPYRGGRES